MIKLNKDGRQLLVDSVYFWGSLTALIGLAISLVHNSFLEGLGAIIGIIIPHIIPVYIVSLLFDSLLKRKRVFLFFIISIPFCYGSGVAINYWLNWLMQGKDADADNEILIFIYALMFIGFRYIRIGISLKTNAEVMKADYLRNVTESKLMSLRAQLNPHFIFNCLNSINSYILISDSKKGSEILVKFAKLIRLILENSDKKFIPLEEDIFLLKLYTDVEQERTKNLFKIFITTDSAIDSKRINVPSLIAQPFIENSIWHAFNGREHFDNNEIHVNYYMKDKTVFCSIEDNGIGRKNKSEGISIDGKGKSLGISISDQRLNLLATEKSTDSFIKIEDKVNENGQGIGTRVIIKIPYSKSV